MYSLIPIVSLDLPELEPYRTMRRTEEHRTRGIFVAEGDKVVHRLLASSLEVISLLIPPERLPEFVPALEQRSQPISVYTAPKTVLESLTGYPMYQGVLAIGTVPPSPSLTDIANTPDRPPLLAALEGVSNAENVGVIIRNAAAFGLDGVIIGESSCSPYLRRAVRNSMGAVFNLPVLETPDLTQTLLDLKGLGIRLIAAHPHTQQITLGHAPLHRGSCVVLGSEGDGITPNTLALCDDHVAIPMQREVDSLNVACASAAFFFEFRRQHPPASRPL